MKGTLVGWLDRVQPSESAVVGGAALLVGLTTGIGVWVFKQLIDVVQRGLYGGLGSALTPLGSWTLFVLPVIGGLIVGFIMHRFVGEERHHGVAGIMEAVAISGGRLRYQRVPAKAIAAGISIGAGASVGPEDPSVQIGSNLGSMFGQVLHLSDERVRVLVAAGAAAAIAAAFNAPIAGIFFALELIMGELTGSTFGGVVVAAVTSAVFTQAVSGVQPAFHVPAYQLSSPLELPLYLVLGLLAGPVATLYIRAIYKAQDVFQQLKVPRWLKPAIAGAIVGLVGLALPQVLGIGYSTIERILNGENLSIGLLIALLIGKLLMTPISIGGGFPGGVFAPSLFLGAALGGAFGTLVQQIMPGVGPQAPAFAMVGMAAVLAATVHAPLTAIILLFEMTNDYRIILPLMFAVAISLLVEQRLQGDSVYTLGLARKGIRLQRGRDVEVLDMLNVSEVMQAAPTALHETDSVSTAIEILNQTRHHGLPVVNDADDLTGILTLQDVERVPAEARNTTSIGAACTHELLTVFPDETIGAALRRMGGRDIGRLPVVERDRPQHLIGVLRRSDLVRAYDLALTRRTTMRHHAQQVRLGAFTGAQVIELVVPPDAPCTDHRIKDVAWPRDCVLASVRRGRQLLIPHGDTVLRGGDVLAIVSEDNARLQLGQLKVKDANRE